MNVWRCIGRFALKEMVFPATENDMPSCTKATTCVGLLIGIDVVPVAEMNIVMLLGIRVPETPN